MGVAVTPELCSLEIPSCALSSLRPPWPWPRLALSVQPLPFSQPYPRFSFCCLSLGFSVWCLSGALSIHGHVLSTGALSIHGHVLSWGLLHG